MVWIDKPAYAIVGLLAFCSFPLPVVLIIKFLTNCNSIHVLELQGMTLQYSRSETRELHKQLMINPLITKLSCWNFNLVNADHFSREYLVCLLCYWSQICVLLRQWVGAIAHTHVGRYAPPTSKVKPIKCNDLVKFCSKLVLWGWLLKSTYK